MLLNCEFVLLNFYVVKLVKLNHSVDVKVHNKDGAKTSRKYGLVFLVPQILTTGKELFPHP